MWGRMGMSRSQWTVGWNSGRPMEVGRREKHWPQSEGAGVDWKGHQHVTEGKLKGAFLTPERFQNGGAIGNIIYPEKHLFLLYWLCQSLWCVDHNKLWKMRKDGHTRPPDLPLEKPVCRSGSNNLNWTWNNRLVPNRKGSMSRLYIVILLI